MKAIITGASGAVGSGLKQLLEGRGETVVAWDRGQIPIDDYAAMENFVRAEQPDVVFHLATASKPTGREKEGWWVNYHWTSELAWICRQLNVRFVFTSSVMVYTNQAVGPFTSETVPDEVKGYGYEKLQAEERALEQNPDAVIARIGWQIGQQPGSNNMLEFFERQMQQHGEVKASQRWYPACSFIPDTASALVDLAQQAGGVYLVDSNERWTFYEVASALNALHQERWKVTPTEDFVYDQRMIDPRVTIPALNVQLPSLP